MEFNRIVIDFFKAKYLNKDLTFTKHFAKVSESKVQILFNDVDVDAEIAELPGEYSVAETQKIFAEIERVYNLHKRVVLIQKLKNFI